MFHFLSCYIKILKNVECNNGYRTEVKTMMCEVSMSAVSEYGTVRRTLLYGTVRYWMFEYPYQISFIFMLLIKTIFFVMWLKCIFNNNNIVCIIEKNCYSMVRCGTVSTPYWGRKVRYGTDIWVVLLLPSVKSYYYFYKGFAYIRENVEHQVVPKSHFARLFTVKVTKIFG